MHALRLAVRSGTLAGVLLALACRRVTPSPPPGADASAPLVITKPPASAGMSNPAAPPDAEAPDAAGGDAGADAGAGEQLERVKDSPNGADVGTLTLTRRTQDAIDFSLSVANGYYMGQLEGTAVRRGAVLRFPDAPTSDCELTFTPAGSGFRVEERGMCIGWHGVGVSFSGVYRPPASRIRPSFDCKDARSPVALAICADEVLADLDRELDRVYRARLASASERGALAAEQRRWLAGLAGCTGDEGEAATLCLVRRFLARASALGGDAAVSDRRPPALYPTLRAAVTGGTFESALWSPRAVGVLRVLLGPRFYTFRRFMGSLSAKMDNGYACVRGGVPGLFTAYEGLVAVGPAGDVWAAILDSPEGGGTRVELYGLDAKSGDAPPAVFDTWRARFAHAGVKRLDVPYAR